MTSTLPAPRACAGCGKPILFARTQDGKIMPLDQTETEIFVVAEQTGLLGERELTLIDRVRGHVTHFATCPKAATFRRRKTADEHE